MESIKFTAKGHRVEFSKRTLTIDGKVYSYTGISQVKHSSAYKAYLFRYNNEWVKLFYDEPHANVVAALFRKINAMNARRAAKARATQSIDTAAIAAALAAASGEEPEVAPEVKPAAAPVEVPAEEPAVVVPEAPAEEPAAEVPAAPAEEPAAEVPAAEAEPIPIPVVKPILELEPEVEAPAEEPAVEVPAEEPAVEVPAEEPAVEVPAEEPTVEVPAEEPTVEVPAEEPAAETPAEKSAEEVLAEAEAAKIKKAKRKKAFIIFAIIIALFIVAGIIYFLTVGTTNDASQGPNIDETHQYNDIEELIEEMQE